MIDASDTSSFANGFCSNARMPQAHGPRDRYREIVVCTDLNHDGDVSSRQLRLVGKGKSRKISKRKEECQTDGEQV